MFKLLLLVCALSPLVLGKSFLPRHDGKIIGGEKAVDGQFPSIVSLQYKSSRQHFCGGGIISDRLIISAGHCFIDNQDPADTIVYAGSIDNTQGGETYTLSRVVVNENFNGVADLHNDITLLQTSQPIKFNDRVQPVALPTKNLADGTPITALGWGTINYPIQIYPKILHFVELATVSNSECADKLNADIADSQICVAKAKGEGLCYGDSGSPLINDNTTYGIVSWGQPCAKGFPDVFTRVLNFVDWIKDKEAQFLAEDSA